MITETGTLSLDITVSGNEFQSLMAATVKKFLSSSSFGLLGHNRERVSSCVSFVDCKKSFSCCYIV